MKDQIIIAYIFIQFDEIFYNSNNYIHHFTRHNNINIKQDLRSQKVSPEKPNVTRTEGSKLTPQNINSKFNKLNQANRKSKNTTGILS